VKEKDRQDARQEMVQVIYQYRKAYYDEKNRVKHCARRAKVLEAAGNREQVEAYREEMERRNKAADFLVSEIRTLKEYLDRFDRAA
jgi:hypothetical protein